MTFLEIPSGMSMAAIIQSNIPTLLQKQTTLIEINDGTVPLKTIGYLTYWSGSIKHGTHLVIL